MDSIFKAFWAEGLKNEGFPSKFTGTKIISYEELKRGVDKRDLEFAKNLVFNFLNGKVLIVKKSFGKELVETLKKEVIKFWDNNPNTYHEMKEGCVDFHRVITPEIAQKYSLGAVRHSTYFFPWNNGLGDSYDEIYNRWGYLKYVAGLNFDQYEKNTPKDIAIDRLQIVCYPPGCGGVEKHTDTDSNCNLAISCHLSSRQNLDYKNGGFYAVNKDNVKIDIEPEINTGDMSVYCPTVEHGVSSIDPDYKEAYDWNSGIGRWWMGLFSPDSNEIKKRNTSKSLETFHSKHISENK